MMPSNLMPIVEQIKFIITVGGGFWAAFSAYTWVKASLTNTQEGVKGIQTELTKQTHEIVKATDTNTKEVSELRTDVGRLIQSMMAPPSRARAARAARRKK